MYTIFGCLNCCLYMFCSVCLWIHPPFFLAKCPPTLDVALQVGTKRLLTDLRHINCDDNYNRSTVYLMNVGKRPSNYHGQSCHFNISYIWYIFLYLNKYIITDWRCLLKLHCRHHHHHYHHHHHHHHHLCAFEEREFHVSTTKVQENPGSSASHINKRHLFFTSLVWVPRVLNAEIGFRISPLLFFDAQKTRSGV